MHGTYADFGDFIHNGTVCRGTHQAVRSAGNIPQAQAPYKPIREHLSRGKNG